MLGKANWGNLDSEPKFSVDGLAKAARQFHAAAAVVVHGGEEIDADKAVATADILRDALDRRTADPDLVHAVSRSLLEFLESSALAWQHAKGNEAAVTDAATEGEIEDPDELIRCADQTAETLQDFRDAATGLLSFAELLSRQ